MKTLVICQKKLLSTAFASFVKTKYRENEIRHNIVLNVLTFLAKKETFNFLSHN